MRFRRGAHVLLACAFFVTALAGCFQDAPVAEADPPPAAAPPPIIAPINRTLHFADCQRFTHSYTTAGAFFDGQAPNGFQVAGGSRVPGTSQLSLFIDVCPGADDLIQEGNTTTWEPSISVIAALPVVPPSEEADQNLTRNYVPLAIAIQGASLLERYHAWGFELAQEATFAYNYANDGVQYQVSLDWQDASGTFAAASAGQAGSGVLSSNAFRLWASSGGEATGSVLLEYGQGARVGTGAARMTFDGEGALPPAAAGTSNDGEGVESYARYLPRGAPVPSRLTDTG